MPDFTQAIRTEHHLIALCFRLLDSDTPLTEAERALIQDARHVDLDESIVAQVRQSILLGADPLGDVFASVRSAQDRRGRGAVYTPGQIVESMMTWLAAQGTPARIVDPGAGSGRFIVTAGQAFPNAQLVAVELDPLAALLLRTNLCVVGLSERTLVLVDDYRNVELPACEGVTAFIGNPPYVRHHDIEAHWKAWYTAAFKTLGIKASALAGLHLHFFLKTRLLAKPGDLGAFITSSEWLDVNYGAALRHLLLDELGGVGLHVLTPTVEAFPGTATTAAITCFQVGQPAPSLRVRSVDHLDRLNGLSYGTDIARETLSTSPRWSILIRPSTPTPAGQIELGELFRVHRGQVTGANGIWIAGEQAADLPDSVKFPAITKARDLIVAGETLRSAAGLRKVIDLPVTLDSFTDAEQQAIEIFLAWARSQNADQSYIAQHRKAWWSVGLKAPAPILCTYMARRPPQFTLNACNARHINIAHGLYPRAALPAPALQAIVEWLNQHIQMDSGRVYAGGLAKFEPKEIERLRIPALETLL